MIKWHTGDGLRRFAEDAAADLGLSTRHVNALAEWMVRFQRRPKQGGVVLAEESAAATHGEVVLTDEQHVDEGEPEQLQEVQYQFHPADAYTDDGELRVYTQPLDNGASPAGRRRSMVRYAVHDVVTVCLTSCMNLSGRDESGEMHTAVVVSQHRDGSCNVRLLDDLATIVRSVYAQLSSVTLDADAHARGSAYVVSDVHQTGNLYTEGGTHVSRHAMSTAMMNEGAAGGSARSRNGD